MAEDGKVLIDDLSWGEIEVSVAGRVRQFRDCKCWPGGASEWDWNETGTHHSPGIQVADIEQVLKHDIEVMILSRGQQRRLQVMEETKKFLRDRGIPFHIEETNQAVDHFNELSQQGKRVGGIFHTTC